MCIQTLGLDQSSFKKGLLEQALHTDDRAVN